MDNIIQFERKEVSPIPCVPVAKEAKKSINGPSTFKVIVRALNRFIWLLTVICWPLLKFIATAEVTFQFFRMLYYWENQEIYAGWTFLIHFTVFVALTYYVSVYEPKHFLTKKKC